MGYLISNRKSHFCTLLKAFALSLLTACSESSLLPIEEDESISVETPRDTLNTSTHQSSSSSKKQEESCSSKTTMESSSSQPPKESSSSEAPKTESSSGQTISIEDSLGVPQDSAYPYADIPRIVIETEGRQKIEDRENEIPAKLRIWGKESVLSDLQNITIRGRGNSSWEMPQKGYKIEFEKGAAPLGLPQNRDWALIANYADKSLVKNYITYRLSEMLGALYSPKCDFAELYLNGEYQGVYLLTETIKVGKNRVNIPKDNNSFLVEADEKYKDDEQVIFSDILTRDSVGKAYRVHNPKDASEFTLSVLKKHIEEFENFIYLIDRTKPNDIEAWLDIDESIKFYWIQEFSKNPDALFYTSVYFTWTVGDKIKMGPVWDFDLAYGGHESQEITSPTNWYITKYWYKFLVRDADYKSQLNKFWFKKRNTFEALLDTVDATKKRIKKAANNNFKRWDILGSTAYEHHTKQFNSYDEAILDLKNWMIQRIEWIDENLDPIN